MSGYVLKNSIHTVIGETILADIRSQRSSYYFFVGGVDLGNVGESTEADPSYAYELASRNEIISMKKISASDASFVIPRIDWTEGTVYDYYADYTSSFPAYSGATSLDQALFYVLTDDFRVYKCLWNGLNAPSTIKPTSTLSAPFVTADGYRWKFMYSLPLSSRSRFLNTTFMPVQTALTQQFYSAGQITDTTIMNQGSGYTTANITVTGDGNGARLTPVINNGQIVQIVVDDSGDGYTYANISVTGDGAGASVVANLSVGDLDTSQADVELLSVDGSIEAYQVINPGSGYSEVSVTIEGDGTGATASAIISNGKIIAIISNNSGSGYTYANITISGDGTGAQAVPIISPFGGHGKNAVSELFASRISFFSNLLNDKNQGMKVRANLRQIGVIRNPKEYGIDKFFTEQNASSCMLFTYTGAQPVVTDMFTELNTGSRFRVVNVNSTQLLVQNLDNYNLQGNSVLLNSSGGQIAVSTVVNPTVNKFSGDLIFIDNFGINQSDSSQIIIFKTTLKF